MATDAINSALGGDNAPDNSAEAPTAAPTPTPQPTPTPTPAAPQAPLNLQPAKEAPENPGQWFRHMGRSFAGAVLGVLGGPQEVVDGYSVDENGKMTPNVRKIGGRDRLTMLAHAALQGLAASATVPPQKSGLASALAGFGAGAGAVQQQTQQQDLLKRQQAKEQFEQQQKATLNRAAFAMHNAQMANYWLEAAKKQQDMDSEGNTNDAIAQSVENYITENPGAAKGANPVTVQRLSAEQAAALRGKQNSGDAHTPDSHPIGNNVILPGKLKPMIGPDGEPFRNADGSIKMTREFLLIGGSHDGKFAAPEAWTNEVQKYAPIMAGQMSGLQAGQDISLHDFARVNTLLVAAKKKVADETPQVGFDKDKKQILIYPLRARLGLDNATQPVPAGAQYNIKNEPAESAADVNLKGAEAEQKRIEANQQKLLNPKGSEGLSGEDYLKTLPPAMQDTLKAVAEGRETRSPRQLQDKNGNPTPFAQALHRGYPDFDDKKAAAYGGVVKDFTSGPTSRTLTAYGTALNHARLMYDNTGPASYMPGTAENKAYNQYLTYVATEVAKALNPTGVATENAIKEQEDALRSAINRKGAIKNAVKILSGKMSEIKQRWLDGQVRPSYQPPMPNLSKEALDNAEYVLNDGQTQPKVNPFRKPTGQ